MKIYEYAKKRNIKSRDVVKVLHQLGYKHVKNHLSLIPLKIIDKLDEIEFAQKKQSKTIVFISFLCAPFTNCEISKKVRNKINQCKGNNNIIIIPHNNMDIKLDEVIATEVIVNNKNIKGKVYYTKYRNDDYYLVKGENVNKEVYQIAFFNKMALTIIKYLNIDIDIINIHHWQLGLFPLMFKELEKDYPKIKIEFSVYKPTYSGLYDKEIITNYFDIDEKEYPITEYAGSVNMLKAGLVSADKFDIKKDVLQELKASYLKEFIYDNM